MSSTDAGDIQDRKELGGDALANTGPGLSVPKGEPGTAWIILYGPDNIVMPQLINVELMDGEGWEQWKRDSQKAIELYQRLHPE